MANNVSEDDVQSADHFVTCGRTPAQSVGLGCLLAASLIAIPVTLLFGALLFTHAVALWNDPNPPRFTGVDPRANAAANVMMAASTLGFALFGAWWSAKRLFFGFRGPVGYIVAPGLVTVFTPKGAVEFPLATLTDCRAIDYYDFVAEELVESGAAGDVPDGEFAHPKHGRGVTSWKGKLPLFPRSRPLVLVVGGDGRRAVVDVPDPKAMIASVERRRGAVAPHAIE